MKRLKLSDLNLFTVLRDLVYNFWVLVLAFLVGFVGVRTYFDFVFVPLYRSSMTVAVNVSGSNVAQNITKTIEIAGIFQNVFQSDVMKKIIRENDENLNLANVSAQAVEQTNLLRLTATGPDSIAAYKTLKAVYENYENVFDGNIFDDVYINVVTSPSVPSAPYNTVNTKKYSLVAGAGLAVVFGLLICLFSALRDTVKQESDIESFVEAPDFGLIYHQFLSRSRKRKLKKEKAAYNINILDPTMGYAFSESVNRVATKIEYLKNSRSAKTFIITSVDEHEGKTTVSVNVALNLALKGYKTLLVDADLRRPTVFRFFSNELLNSYNEFGDYLLGKADFEDIIKHDEKSSLDIIGGKNSYRFAFELLGSKRFKELLKTLYREYDYILIDTPPTSLTADTENIADLVDVSVLVVRQDRTPVAQINDAADILSSADSYFAGCVLNDYRDVYSSIFKGRMSEEKGGYSSYYYK